MKRVLEYSFLLIISSFSFYLSSKTIMFLRQKDKIMTYLHKIDQDYLVYPKEAIIDNDTIIPGLNGLKINKDKSYNNIKMVGSFNANLLKYDTIYIKNKLNNNKDKYIIKGNKYKNMISIILYLDDYSNLAYLNKIDTPLNFIVNYYYLNNHLKEIKQLISNGHNILITDNNSFDINVDKNYCFNKNKNDDFKKQCFKHGYYSIYQERIINNNYLNNIKKNLKAGSFIVLKGHYEDELELIINYIYNKGFKIANLNNHLTESM